MLKIILLLATVAIPARADLPKDMTLAPEAPAVPSSPYKGHVPRIERRELINEKNKSGELERLLVEVTDLDTKEKTVTLTTYSLHHKLETTTVWVGGVPSMHSEIFQAIDKRTLHVCNKPDASAAKPVPAGDEAGYRKHVDAAAFLEKEVTVETQAGRKISLYRRKPGQAFKRVSERVVPWTPTR